MVTLLVMFVLAPLWISLLTIPALPSLAAIMRAVSWESWNQIDNVLADVSEEHEMVPIHLRPTAAQHAPHSSG